MAKFKSEFSWSFSRNSLFRECRRAYFYYYYASWGGWDRNVNVFIRRAYILKNIRNTDAWIGDIVHQVIKWILESKINCTPNLFNDKGIMSHTQAVLKAKKMLSLTWEQSRSRQWEKNVKNNLNLFEHYYDIEMDRDILASKLQKVTKSLRSIYSGGFLDSLDQIAKDGFLTIDELDSFDFEGTKLYAIPDFAVRNNGYILYDWKTGKPYDKDVLQLSCYILYAMSKWKANPSDIKIIPVYLAQDGELFEAIKPVELEEVKNYIRDSIKEMKSVLIDLENNKTDIKNCPKMDNTIICKRCRFKEICK